MTRAQSRADLMRHKLYQRRIKGRALKWASVHTSYDVINHNFHSSK